MAAPLDCPEIASWPELLGNTVPPDRWQQWERHLESCETCQTRLHQAEGLWGALGRLGRQLGDPTREPCDPTLRQVRERLYGVGFAVRTSPPQPPDLSFLRAAERPDLLGTLANYEVGEVLGQGGMGIVLKAHDPALRRVVAVKVLLPHLAASATARRRFTREAQAAAAVRHEHVVAVHAVAETDGLPYLVMQYVAGESLQARLDRAGPLEVAEVVRIGQETALGLAAAHSRGLVHRDVTPANLLLEGEPGTSATGARVKITDFGLARAVDDVGLTQAGVVAGTPEYMAPEQARGEPIDHRADLYALGAVLYACCTGAPPFRGETVLAVLRRVSDETPPPLRELKPDVPAWLEAFLTRLLAKDPAQRFQSAAEVATLLGAYRDHLRQPEAVPAPPLLACGGRPGLAPGPAPTGPVPAPHRRLGPAAFLLIAALGLAGALVGLRLLAAGVAGPTATANPSAVPVRRLQGHTGPVHDIRFTADGRLVSGSGWPNGDQTVRVWDTATGQERSRMAVPAQVHSLDLSHDGRLALVGLANGCVLQLDLETGQALRLLQGHGGSVGWVAFGPDETQAFSAASDGTVRWWDLGAGKPVGQVRVQAQRARGGALFPDGRRLLTADGGGLLQTWDIATGHEVRQVLPPRGLFIDSVRLWDDGRQALVTGVGGAHLYDLETGREVRTYQDEEEEVHKADVSPDGRWLLTAGFDGKVRLWDFRSGALVRVLGSHDGMVLDVAFAPDGRLAASAGGGERIGNDFGPGSDHDIRLYDLTALPAAAGRPAGGRGWAAAAGLLFLVVALAFLAMVWHARRSRRNGSAPPDVAGPTGRGDAEDQPPLPAPTPPPITVPCSGCGRNLKARATLAGKRVKCPQCGQAVLVPSVQAAKPGSPS